MSIVWILVAVAACILSGVGTAGFMRARMKRERLIGEIEDPRDTQIRELLVAVKVARENEARARAGEKDNADELAQAQDRVRELEKLRASDERGLEAMQGRIEGLLGERNQLEENLAGTRSENERLHSRVEELEMERSMGRAADMLDPELQAS
jgi:chromosome segregation ATPase